MDFPLRGCVSFFLNLIVPRRFSVETAVFSASVEFVYSSSETASHHSVFVFSPGPFDRYVREPAVFYCAVPMFYVCENGNDVAGKKFPRGLVFFDVPAYSVSAQKICPPPEVTQIQAEKLFFVVDFCFRL